MPSCLGACNYVGPIASALGLLNFPNRETIVSLLHISIYIYWLKGLNQIWKNKSESYSLEGWYICILFTVL